MNRPPLTEPAYRVLAGFVGAERAYQMLLRYERRKLAMSEWVHARVRRETQ